MKNGTPGEIFCEAVRVQVQPDFDGVLSYEGHIVVRDVVVGAVGKVNTEWLERAGLEQVANLFGGDHFSI